MVLDQRYYASNFGRFNTPDRYRAKSGTPTDPENPLSWNRLAYASGDPINSVDPSGRIGCDPSDPKCWDPGCDPDDPTCRTYPEPEPPPDPPYLPECKIELWSRPAGFNHDRGSHTYIDFINITLGVSDIFEGGPDKQDKKGTLLGLIEPPDPPLGKGTGHGTNPNKPHNQELGFPVAVPCSDEYVLELHVKTYDASARVPYKAIPNGKANWNSNSFSFTLLADIDLSTGSFGIGNLPTRISLFSRFYPGWGYAVPGL